MKHIFLIVFNYLFISQLLGQSFFDADGIQIKTGAVSCTYNFDYAFGDSLTMFFIDSVVQYSNAKETVIKTITYSHSNKNSEPSINIKYLGTNGRDSISEHFFNGKLSMTYQTKYDNVGKVTYYGMKDFNADSTFDRSFEWFYEYRDSSISTGKIEIQTIFYFNRAGDKTFHFRVLNVYDSRNRKVKMVRESEPNDSMAQITTYTYNDKDSLISREFDGTKYLYAREKQMNTKCDIEYEYSFVATDYNSIRLLIHQLLIENKNQLTKNKCENYLLTLTSFDKLARLTIVKAQPYSEDRRTVIFTKTKNFMNNEE